MPYVATALTSLCLSLASSGQYNAACNKASEAGAKQVGVYQTLEDAEHKTMVYATELGENTLGKKTMDVGGSAVYLYRCYRDKSVIFKLNHVPMADSITNQVTKDSVKMSINWHF